LTEETFPWSNMSSKEPSCAICGDAGEAFLTAAGEFQRLACGEAFVRGIGDPDLDGLAASCDEVAVALVDAHFAGSLPGREVGGQLGHECS
jgi:hypothetical protein